MVSLNPKKNHIHFIGVAGIGMSALALVLVKRGYSVSGSDKNTNEITVKLSQAGVTIFKEQKDINIQSICKNNLKNLLIVISSAIPLNNPELKEAKDKGLEIFHRSDILNALINQQPSILIAGSHGKTTTSTIVTTLLDLCKKDPTAIIGGIVPIYKSNGHSGEGKYLVAEADESDGTLIKLKGEIGLITNLELDHTDYYNNIKSLEETIKIFGQGCKQLIINYDSYNLRNIFNRNEISYSITTKDNVNFSALPILMNGNGTVAEYYEDEKFIDHIKIPLIGSHNLSNTIGAIAVCRKAGVKFNELKNIIHKLKSPKRRFELKGTWEGKQIIDDYAHHPSEIKAAISIARIIIDDQANLISNSKKRLIIVFQPHRYSRTKDLIHEFAKSFDKSNAVCLLPIYTAGENPIDGVDSESLALLIKQNSPNIPVSLANSYEDLKNILSKISLQNDLILFLGAGDINKFSKKILSKDQNSFKKVAA